MSLFQFAPSLICSALSTPVSLPSTPVVTETSSSGNCGKGEGCHPQPSSSPQKPQPSPGAQSSCSSDHSPAGSAANTDSGVEMTVNTGGSTEDLSSLDEGPCIAGTGLSTLRRLENLRLDQLHQLRPTGPRGLKLPSLTHTGEIWVWWVVAGLILDLP